MEVLVREYEDKDHMQICLWLKKRGLGEIPKDFLSPIGLIVDGMACGFLYLTKSSMAFLDCYISNPETLYTERHNALNRISKELIAKARDNNVKYLKTNTKSESMRELALKNDFKYLGIEYLFLKEL